MKKLISLVAAIISFAFLASITFALSPVKPPFTDVQSGDEYYHAIIFLKDKEVINGYEDGSFKPNQVLNRAEFLKILMLAFPGEGGFSPSQHKSEKCFTDIDPNAWYTEYVCYAKARGIVSGYQDGTFKPNQEINLVEGLKVTLKSMGEVYTETDPWYKGVVDKSSDFNIIPLSFIYFNDEVTRGEMADMATRASKSDYAYQVEGEDLATYLKLSLGDKADQKVTYQTLKAPKSGGDSAYCTAEPEQTDIGSLEYPTDPQYENVGSYLGQLLTASDCEDDTRVNNIFGVSEVIVDEWPNFTLGSSLGLDGAPSAEFLGVLKDIGYDCTEAGTSDSQCVKWELTNEVPLYKLFDLKPYVNEIKFGDCVNCG